MKKEMLSVEFIESGYTRKTTLTEVTAPREKRYITAADYRPNYDIYEAYEKPSIYKVRAWNYCKEMCKALNGFNLRITGHNCMAFTVKFEFAHPENGALCTAWITKDYDRFCYQ